MEVFKDCNSVLYAYIVKNSPWLYIDQQIINIKKHDISLTFFYKNMKTKA